jgi:lycopene cyclase domain-containing protein
VSGEHEAVNQKFQYLALLGLCLVGTLPLEFRFAARVWRRPKELFVAIIGPFVAFNVINEIAVNRELWRYATRFTTGFRLPRHYPIEEVVFFVVVPICGLLTFEAATNVYSGSVRSLLGRRRHRPLVVGRANVVAGAVTDRVDGVDGVDRVDGVDARLRTSRSVSPQQFLSGLLLAVCGLLLMFELWFNRDHFSSVTQAGDGLLRQFDWNIPEYSVLAVGLLAGALFLERCYWHTGVFRLRAYWSTMAICLVFMVAVNGWLTKSSAPIVVYSRDEFSGLRPIWDIPLEDFAFGVSLLTVMLMSWVRTTRITPHFRDRSAEGGLLDAGSKHFERHRKLARS